MPNHDHQPTTLGFVDIETTGLDPYLHEPWEVALLLVDGATLEPIDECTVWQLPVDLGRADPAALMMNGFFDDGRRWPMGTGGNTRNKITRPEVFAKSFMERTRGVHLAGVNVKFDERRLDMVLRENNACPCWHYHSVDVLPLVAGALAGRRRARTGTRATVADYARPPWKSNDLSKRIGVDPADFDRHSAKGDVEWALAMYRAVIAPRPPS